MRLYFMPGACSLAPHIALREADLTFDLVEVDYQSRRTTGGGDYREVNPKGYVPTLVLETGETLTEVPVILQYVDSLVPEAALLPHTGVPRLRSLEWLNFIATEIHKSFSPLFRPDTPPSFIEPGKRHLRRRLSVVEQHLRQHPCLMGPRFSLADVYLHVVCRWLDDLSMVLADWPALERHTKTNAMRPSFRQAMAREGLI